MKAALSFASAACLPAALSQPVQAQADWQAHPNCAPDYVILIGRCRTNAILHSLASSKSISDL